PRPPASTLFPYTTLFRSKPLAASHAGPLNPGAHFAAKAKHVIHVFAGGGPSHVDTFDPKPALAKFDGQTLPGMNGLAYPSPFKRSEEHTSELQSRGHLVC